uniref:HDC19959 n=1 Tax=Drosophila melanogaster TaxID=7227 RepID=Q6II25_DROME|nr:TPA_inf: HDC19959 [Drosophila melanogaster]
MRKSCQMKQQQSLQSEKRASNCQGVRDRGTERNGTDRPDGHSSRQLMPTLAEKVASIRARFQIPALRIQ